MKPAAVLLVLALLSCTGCSKQETPPPPPSGPALPKTVTFTDTNEVVAGEQVVVTEKSKAVTADLNLDGLQDVVMIEEAPDGREQVSIYIRKPVPDALPTPPTTPPPTPPALEPAKPPPPEPVFEVDMVSFYRAGVIHPLSSGRIIGLMTKRGRDAHTDILIVVAHPDGHNEIVHYQNEGTRFVMVR